MGETAVSEVVFGRAEVLWEGGDIALIAAGNCVLSALRAAERLEKIGVHATVINARFIKPLDKEMILRVSAQIPKLITIEENVLQGGFGSSVLECLSDAEGNGVKVKRLGIPDRFMEQGGQDRLRAKYGIDEEGIFLAALSFMREHTFSN